jgi:hypothetical protein
MAAKVIRLDTIKKKKEFLSALQTNKKIESTNYGIKSSFNIGDLIAHPSFGEGFVLKKSGDKKIHVFFEDKERILVHNM